jgi:hypothetical protein
MVKKCKVKEESQDKCQLRTSEIQEIHHHFFHLTIISAFTYFTEVSGAQSGKEGGTGKACSFSQHEPRP